MKKIIPIFILILILESQGQVPGQTNLNRAILSYPGYTNFTKRIAWPSTNAGIVTTNVANNFILALALNDPAFVSWLLDRIAIGLTNR